MAGENLLQIGMECLKDGRLDEAITHLEKAASQSPNDYQSLNFLGVAYARKGLNNRAIGTLEAAVKIRPDSAAIHYNLGIAYLADGFGDRAKDHFTKALQLDPKYTRAAQALNTMVGMKDSALGQSCARHGNEPAVGTCSICRLAICKECRTIQDGKLVCTTCAAGA